MEARRYTIHVEDGTTACEITGVSIPDNRGAREYAVLLISNLFMSPQIVSFDWDSCWVRVMSDGGDQVFATTAQDAALIERDELSLSDASANH